MILRALALALCGMGAAFATLHFAKPDGNGAAAVQSVYAPLPLVAVPRIERGRLSGLDFLRLGAVAGPEAGLESPAAQAFLADAVLDATLGSASGGEVNLPLLRAAVPVRLRRAGAPFALERLVVLQSEYRSQARLRSDAEQWERAGG